MTEVRGKYSGLYTKTETGTGHLEIYTLLEGFLGVASDFATYMEENSEVIAARLYKVFAYEGPNIAMMLTLLMKRMGEYWNSLSNTEKARWAGARTYDASDNSQVIAFRRNFIQTAITFFLLRGGNFTKVKEGKSLSTEASDLITEVTTGLQLVDKLGKTAKGSNNITLARVCMCFPHYTLSILRLFENWIQIPARNKDLPVIFHTTVAPSMWTEDLWKKHNEAHLKWMIEFTKLTQTKVTDETLKTSESQLKSIQLAAYNSKAFNMEFRNVQLKLVEKIAPLDDRDTASEESTKKDKLFVIE